MNSYKNVESRRIWEREFFVSPRFIPGIPQYGGSYACIMCDKFRADPTMWPDKCLLVEHIYNEHINKELMAGVGISEKR